VKKKNARSKSLSRGFRIVALGGGTGLSALLRGLKEHVIRDRDKNPTPDLPISDLAAIVTVTDDGGSSGRLRRETGSSLPVISVIAWSRFPTTRLCWAACFNIAFMLAAVLIGHNFGNLFLAALTHITGDFTEAIRESSKVLAIRGRIFPSTLANVHLVATLTNGRRVRGETRITASRVPIKKLELSPKRVRPLPLAIEAIKEADLILLGPGSLYTSVLPNLLIPEVASAIAHSKAPRVYIANLMTQPGETAGYALADHLRAIQNHARAGWSIMLSPIASRFLPMWRGGIAHKVLSRWPSIFLNCANSDAKLFSIICWMSVASFDTITSALRGCCWKKFCCSGQLGTAVVSRLARSARA